MRTLFRRWWSEEQASASPEWAMIATILVLGAITGVCVSRLSTPAEEYPAARVARTAR